MGNTVKWADCQASHFCLKSGRTDAHFYPRSEIRTMVRHGEITPTDTLYVASDSTMLEFLLSVSAGDFIEQMLDHVSSEIEDGCDFVEWVTSEDEAKAELDLFLSTWRIKHIKPTELYTETSTLVDLSELFEETKDNE